MELLHVVTRGWLDIPEFDVSHGQTKLWWATMQEDGIVSTIWPSSILVVNHGKSW